MSVRRLLFFITDLELGGTPTVVRELVTRLMPYASIEVASLKTIGVIGEELQSRGVKVHALNVQRVTELRSAVRQLTHIIRDGDFDTVFSFLIHANFVASRACRKLSTVRCLQSIQTTQPRPRWHWWVQQQIHRFAARVVVPSQSVANRAVERSRVPLEKIVVVPNAVDSSSFAAITKKPNEPGTFRVGFVGRLDPVKCVPDLIEAVSQLPPTVRLDLYGDGSMRETITEGIAKLKLGDRVTLHGAVRDPRIAYSDMDVLVLPSKAEGFGLVLIEAMAAGIPVIGTDVDGIRDVVENEQTGLLVECGKPDRIASAIRRLMDEPALRQGLIARGQHEVSQRFAWPAVIDQYRQLLQLN